ncbi:hypothetical protein [Azospirillum sp. SYSU D00513]|uniref:hypothetical protein n=1 Tax=Azospirillum sp. SYSU D00513 TaxID=2812561 RepID=UPI001A97ACA6|nr:hypothetical protein [Azospirillum sp. SYSU D00513]
MNAISMTLPRESQTASRIDFTSGAPADFPAEVSRTTVPLKPSAAMLASGSRAGGVSVEVAWKIYQAMINHQD